MSGPVPEFLSPYCDFKKPNFHSFTATLWLKNKTVLLSSHKMVLSQITEGIIEQGFAVFNIKIPDCCYKRHSPMKKCPELNCSVKNE